MQIIYIYIYREREREREKLIEEEIKERLRKMENLGTLNS
jgi:hypothetical protein